MGVFDEWGYMAGSDDDRLGNVNDAAGVDR
jgi:hypothetical protein